MITKALQRRGKLLPDLWPGTTFTVDEEEGKALLGMYIVVHPLKNRPADRSFQGSLGASLASFLYSHKARLGMKHTFQVAVFRDDNENWYPQVLFYVQDVPANLRIPQEADGWQPGPAETLRSVVKTTLSLHQRDGEGRWVRVHAL